MNEFVAHLTRGLDPENPWPGLMPFTEATRAYFHGRDAEAAELLRRVRRERLTTLFGQSGLGKTSLLCAGLFPRLRAADFLPVYVRLDWTTAHLSPAAQIKQALAENLAEHGVEGRAPGSDETLWAYFHDKETEFWNRRNRLITPVLVFDQFEEIFTLGHAMASAEAVLEELAALVENRPPASVRAALEEDPEAARRYDFGKESCRVILALREDFLPDLEGLRRRLPSIMENRMRLTRMDGRQARDAILASGSHLIAPDVAEKVIAFVAASRGRAEGEIIGEAELARLEIEPALLSIVCSELNNKRIRLGQPQITADLLEGAQQEIIGQFYASSLAGIDPALRLFIEEQLLTAEGYRDTRPLAEALREPGVTRTDIDKLVARRLLRIEERFGTQWVELTHDLLTGVIRQQRDLRREQTAAAREAEVRAQAERERAERAEAEAARERKEREAQKQLALEAAERERAARRLVRRTQIALAATVFLLLVTVGAMGFAVIEQRRADDRAKDAEQSYKLALDAANGEVEIVDKNYKAGKIGSEVARTLLDRARKTFGGLPGAGEEATTSRARIYLFSTLAETYLTFGDLKAAREAAQTERNLADQFANPGPAEFHDLADSHNKLGEVLTKQGDLAGALDEYRESLTEMTGLAAKDPANGEWQRDLAEAHRNIGDVLAERGNLVGALDQRRASVAILNQLTAKDPANGDWRRDLAQSHQDVGQALQARGDLADAVAEFNSAVAIMMQLTGNEPSNADWQSMLADCQDALGDALVAQGNLADALEQFQRALKILTELTANDSANAKWQHDLAVAHNEIGIVLREKGDLDRALSETTKAADILAGLGDRDPLNTYWQRELAPSHGWVGNVLLDQRKQDTALSKFRTYLTIMTDLVAKDPTNADWQELLADAHDGVAVAQEARGELDEARQEYDAALKIAEQLVAQDQDNAEWERDLVDYHNNVGRVRKAQPGGLPEALEEFRAGLVVTDREVSKDPASAIWQHELAQAHIYIGQVLSGQGDWEDALSELRAGEKILTGLVNKDQTEDHRQTRNIWLQDLASCHNEIAGVLENQDSPDLADAVEEYRAELAARTALAAKNPGNTSWQHDLADGQDRLGTKLKDQDDFTGALAEFRARAETLTELLKSNPTNTDWEEELADSHNEAGDVLESQDKSDLPGAIEEFKAELATRTALAAKNPENTGWQHALADAHERLGSKLHEQGDLAGALTEFRVRTEILSELLKKDPANTDWQQELADSHKEAGSVLETQDNPDLAGAQREYQAELATRTILATKDPGNRDWQHDLMDVHNRLGRISEALAYLATALKEFRAAKEILSELVKTDPTNIDWQQELATSHKEIGAVLKTQNDFVGAREEYQAGLAVMAPLAASDPSNADWQQGLAELHRGRGDAAAAAADSAGAHTEFEACVAVIEPVLSSGSANEKLAVLAAYCRSNATAMGSGESRSQTGQASVP